MTDGRYDGRRGQFDPSRGNNERYDRSSRDERGFFDRARDEVSSWFGDDDEGRGRDSGGQRDDGRFDREQNYSRDRGSRGRDDQGQRPYTGRSAGRSGSDDVERPSGQNFGRGGSQRERAGLTAPTLAGGRHDSDYSQWRSRQIEELDRDYDEFRRENQSRFDSEFSTWRGQRQNKRQMLGNVAEHMEVVGSDGEMIGKVDHVRTDRIILTKIDSPDGRHHSISCTKIDRVEDGKVFLDKTADEARREFSDDTRNRALFERDDQGEDGPHMLNRSFSGTY